MTNKKRSKGYTVKKLGRYRLTRRNILVIEKLLWIYADAYEIKHASAKAGHQVVPPEGRRHMPRKYIDRHVDVRGLSADSVKFLPKYIKKTRYIEVCCGQSIKVVFKPLSTSILAQTNYATGEELRAMNEVVSLIEKYITGLRRSFLNECRLTAK